MLRNSIITSSTPNLSCEGPRGIGGLILGVDDGFEQRLPSIVAQVVIGGLHTQLSIGLKLNRNHKRNGNAVIGTEQAQWNGNAESDENTMGV